MGDCEISTSRLLAHRSYARLLSKPIRARNSPCQISSWRVSWRLKVVLLWKKSSMLELCNQPLVRGHRLQQQQPQNPVAIETKAT